MSATFMTPTESDAPEAAAVHMAAMAADLLTNAQFPSAESKAYFQSTLETSTLQHICDSDKGILAVVDTDSGEMAGVIKWIVHGRTAAEDQVALQEEEIWPPSCRVEYIVPYADMTARARERIMRDKPYYHLTYVCTKPAFAGRGAGSSLMRRVQELAAEEQMEVILEAVPRAVPLYERLGFEVRENLHMMLPPIGGSQATVDYNEKCMVWTPNAPST